MKLPKVQSNIKPRESWDMFVLAGVESMTRRVRGGEEISEQTYADIEQLIRRVAALSEALDARINITGGISEPK